MTEAIIPPEKVEVIEKDLVKIVSEGKTLKIIDQPSYQAAATYLVEVKKRQKRLEEMRTEITKPLNEALKATNNRFKVFTEPLTQVEAIVKDGMASYAAEEEEKAKLKFEEEVRLAKEEAAAEMAEARKKQEEADRLAREAKNKKERGEAEKFATEAKKAREEAEKTEALPIQVEKPETSVRTAAGLIHTKKVWVFQITDPTLIPERFKVVDEKAIRKAIGEGEREIAGVRIFQETQMAGRV